MSKSKDAGILGPHREPEGVGGEWVGPTQWRALGSAGSYWGGGGDAAATGPWNVPTGVLRGVLLLKILPRSQHSSGQRPPPTGGPHWPESQDRLVYL